MKCYIKSKTIFGICRVDLHNRILISTWFDDLHFSASSTARPKLWPRCDGLRWVWSKKFGNNMCSLWVYPVEIQIPLDSNEVLDNFPTLLIKVYFMLRVSAVTQNYSWYSLILVGNWCIDPVPFWYLLLLQNHMTMTNHD